LLPSDPGGIQQELIVQDLPGCKSIKICFTSKQITPAGSFFGISGTNRLILVSATACKNRLF